jgi:hypothetical protein
VNVNYVWGGNLGGCNRVGKKLLDYRRLCNRVLRIPRGVVNCGGGAETEFGEDSRRGKTLCVVVKCWCRATQRSKDEVGRADTEIKFGILAKRLKERLKKSGKIFA